jgi:hypothetical protein
MLHPSQRLVNLTDFPTAHCACPVKQQAVSLVEHQVVSRASAKASAIICAVPPTNGSSRSGARFCSVCNFMRAARCRIQVLSPEPGGPDSRKDTACSEPGRTSRSTSTAGSQSALARRDHARCQTATQGPLARHYSPPAPHLPRSAAQFLRRRRQIVLHVAPWMRGQGLLA